jgi:hypothetical protein
MSTPTRNEGPTIDALRGPGSGALGIHPVGTGVGAAAGGVAAGALAGSVAGPIGTIVGAAIGAVAGGVAGKEIAEAIDSGAEDGYWRENFSSRPYVKSHSSFDDYGPAYRYGEASFGRSKGRSFDDAEADLEQGWQRAKGASNLSWENAKDASRDAWMRMSDAVERAVPGDSDRDGK